MQCVYIVIMIMTVIVLNNPYVEQRDGCTETSEIGHDYASGRGLCRVYSTTCCFHIPDYYRSLEEQLGNIQELLFTYSHHHHHHHHVGSLLTDAAVNNVADEPDLLLLQYILFSLLKCSTQLSRLATIRRVHPFWIQT